MLGYFKYLLSTYLGKYCAACTAVVKLGDPNYEAFKSQNISTKTNTKTNTKRLRTLYQMQPQNLLFSASLLDL
jgi:hypothetical protein